MTTQEGRAPKATELQFFEDCGLEIGFDVDRPSDEPQLSHICWPFPLRIGSLCRSKRVWFQFKLTDTLFHITCAECWTKLEQLQRKDPILLRAIGTLSNSLRIHHQLEASFDGYLFAIDHPDRVSRFTFVTTEKKAVGEIRREIDDDWEKLSTSTLPAMMTEDWWKLP